MSKFQVGDKVARFQLPSGETVLIDADDRELVEAAGPWWASTNTHTTYVMADLNTTRAGPRRKTMLHRLIANPSKGMQVDHINRDGLDNRRSNLRICSESQNHVNSAPREGSTSHFKGVGWHKKGKKWRARATDAEGLDCYLGLFSSDVSAARAYDEFMESEWGSFAWLNRDHFDLEEMA